MLRKSLDCAAVALAAACLFIFGMAGLLLLLYLGAWLDGE